MKKSLFAWIIAFMFGYNVSKTNDVSFTAVDKINNLYFYSLENYYLDKEIVLPPPEDAYEEFIALQKSKNKEKSANQAKEDKKGVFPILTFHRVEQCPKDKITVTPSQFYKTLFYLYHLGFISVSLKDAMENKIKIPEGKKPVVITVDDCLENDLLIETYKKFLEEYRDFNFNLTIFINGDNCAFKYKNIEEIKKTIESYKKLGISIQAHGYHHKNLKNASLEDVVLEIESLLKKMKELGIDKPEYFAYPYGLSPTSKEAIDYLKTKFKYCFVLDGGSCNILYSKNVDPMSISRIDGSDFNFFFNYYLEKNRDKLYPMK